MKPVFSNTFNVSHNKNISEITLTFSHVYTDHTFSMKGGQLTDVSAQLCDDVASVLITKDGAVALARLLSKMVKEWGVQLD